MTSETARQQSNAPARGIPLCVDLDGTLIRSDVTFESICLLARKHPGQLWRLPLWWRRGRVVMKNQLARFVAIDPAALPYNEQLLTWLRQQKALGRTLVLATASHIGHAQAIAEHLGIFDDVVATDRDKNLKGVHKAAALASRFGIKGFDYVGDAMVDLPIFKAAREAILINPSPGLLQATQGMAKVTAIMRDPPPTWKVRLQALRVHQWVKNVLVLVPFALGHQWSGLFGSGLLAMLAMSMAASSAYLLNDLLDLEADRHHPRKRRRPLASGAMGLREALLWIPALFGGAMCLGLIALPWPFVLVLLGYYATTLAYSWILKGIVLLDVLVLAGLYTIRLAAGAAAGSIVVSSWLLAFSLFVFLSLALLKRYTELLVMQVEGRHSALGRGYAVTDLALLPSLGCAAGYMAVLVLALYIDSPDILALYSHPTLVWLLCPLLLYWISRVWLLAHRGQMHDDPVVFAIQDRTSQCIALATLLILWLAI